MNRVHGLDLLRGIAAFIVLFMHVGGFLGGHLAVDFFFMLSGYVMARSYEGRLRTGRITPTGFMVARYRRLWPTMAAGAALGFLFYASTYGLSADGLRFFLFALLLIPAGAVTPYLLNLPAWSIFYELVLNALHGTLFARMSRKALAMVIGGSLIALVMAMQVIGFPRILGETTVTMQVMVLFRGIVSYGAGILLYRLLQDRSPVKIPIGVGLVAVPAYIALVSVVQFPFWPLPFILLVAPVAIVSGLDPDAPERISRLLGDVSFPLYATHFPVILLVGSLGGGAGLALLCSILFAFFWVHATTRMPRPAVATA